MSGYPVLSTQVIGQAESALGAILDPLLARTGTTFDQWLVLTVTAASGSAVDRDQLIARITGARKIDVYQVQTAISALAADGLVRDEPRFGLTEAGRPVTARSAPSWRTSRAVCSLTSRRKTSPPRVASWPSSPPAPTPNSPALSPELK